MRLSFDLKAFSTLIYAGVAIALLLTATILAAPMSIMNSFKFLQNAQAAEQGVSFTITDDPGSWFRSDAGPIGATESLALTTPGNTVYFNMDETNTVHTVTSLLWPSEATGNGFPFDQTEAFHGETQVTLPEPGLYVFVCKLHPFMLAAVIADDESTTDGLDLGETIDLVNGITNLPTSSDLAKRLVRAFYVITGTDNWQDFTTGEWNVDFPSVPVIVTGGQVINLDALDIVSQDLPPLFKPKTKGIGEVWVATQYEETENRDKPGTLTVVDAKSWKVTKKVSLPGIEHEMNNPHNMWTDKDQKLIYATQWFDKYLVTVDRKTGDFVHEVRVGEAPAHVMTRTDTDQVHVSLNGEDSVVELAAGGGSIVRSIDVTGDALPAQPHAHWMGFDGQTMVTPNSNTADSTFYEFGPPGPDGIFAKPHTGVLPIATGMMPDSSKYYVSNFLSNTLSVVSMEGATKGTVIGTIDLLEDYDPINGVPEDGDLNDDGDSIIGALPIQTPVSPNGKYVVTANTLTATITIVDTDTNQAIKTLPCDAGCHGVQFGAKTGGGYYAYVTSKFANTLIVVDIDPDNNGEADDAVIAGRILLDAANNTKTDDDIVEYSGMGGQGVLAIPNVYNGWVQNLPDNWKDKLTEQQQNPLG